MFRDWSPQPASVPTLFARPRHCVPGAPDEPPMDIEWRSQWPYAHSYVEVPGDHCTMVGEHASTTAEAVWTWLSRLPTIEPSEKAS